MGVSVDPAFVQLPEHRPKSTIPEAGGIPLIDLSQLTGAAAAPPAVAQLAAEVGAACREWGFFQVVGHGVPQELVQRALAAQRAFFALPLEEKLRVRRSEENPLGYSDVEHTKNVRDWKEMFDVVPHEPGPVARSSGPELVLKNRWPDSPPGFREAIEEYARVIEELAFKLLELIALSLNLAPKRLHGFFEVQTTFLRLGHYPPCPYPDLALGVGRHKDSGGLTVLYQDDVGGLDVRRQADGEWVRVKPIPYSFIINVGAIIQVWSNDRYESAEHRVSVNSARDRYSIPFFLNPGKDVMVEPLEELTDDDNPVKYRAYSWWEFLATRKAGNFKKSEVENLQISHFRVA